MNIQFVLKKYVIVFMILMVTVTSNAFAETRFGESLCKSPDYHCVTVKSGDNWDSLFPNAEELDIVRRINRMNVALRPGMVIAVPNNLDRLSIYDVSPFPRYIEPNGEKTIFVSQKQLAWGAYDDQGELVWWGPISSGSGHCGAADGYCVTPSGSFRVIRKQDEYCVSTVFPRNADGSVGGAAMPFCMHFMRGFALHGSDSVPGYRASHGCVRMFIEDARWLNEEFINVPEGNSKGTRVIIESMSG